MAQGDLRVAIRYARALFNVALKRNKVDRIAEELAGVGELLAREPQFGEVLRHPRITGDRKKQLLRDIIGDKVSSDVINFISLLIDKDRAAALGRAVIEFGKLVDEHRRQVDAEAVSAVPLTPAQIAALQTQLKATTGYDIRLQTKVDESILGGLILRVGDKLIDGSVTTQLQSLHNQLRRAKVS